MFQKNIPNFYNIAFQDIILDSDNTIRAIEIRIFNIVIANPFEPIKIYNLSDFHVQLRLYAHHIRSIYIHQTRSKTNTHITGKGNTISPHTPCSPPVGSSTLFNLTENHSIFLIISHQVVNAQWLGPTKKFLRRKNGVFLG